LEGLLLTDGYLDKKRGIEYCTTSERLAEGVQQLLLDVGIMANKRVKKFKSNFKSSTGNIAYTVNITRGEDLEKVFRCIDLSCKKNYKELTEHLKTRKNHNTINNVIPNVM